MVPVARGYVVLQVLMYAAPTVCRSFMQGQRLPGLRLC